MKHITPIQIRFKDLDKFDHINNSVYFTYLEIARTKYFDDILGDTIDWTNKGLILANASLDFIKPIRLQDNICVQCSCTKIGNKSFRLEYEVLKDDQVVMAKGETTLVCFDYSTGQSIEMPEEWKGLIKRFED